MVEIARDAGVHVIRGAAMGIDWGKLRMAEMFYDARQIPNELVERVARAMHGANYLSALRDVSWESSPEQERAHWLYLAKAGLIAVCGFDMSGWPTLPAKVALQRQDDVQRAEKLIRDALSPLPEGCFVKAQDVGGGIIVGHGEGGLAFVVTYEQIMGGIKIETITEQFQALVTQQARAAAILRPR